MKWRKRLGLGIFFLLLTGAIVYGFLPKPIAVDTAAVTQGPLRVTVEEEGRTRLIDRFEVSAPVAGFVQRIQWDVGDTIGRGQILAELEQAPSTVLDPRSRAEAQARVEAAEATLKMSRENTRAAAAQADYAAAELRRLQKLWQTGGTTEENVDRAKAEARRTQANLRSAQFAVEVARFEREAAATALRYSAATRLEPDAESVAIRAPVDGRVLKVYRKSEGVISGGEPLLEIGDPRALEVEVDVLSADAVRIVPGDRVLFEHWGGDNPLEGRVRTVEPVGFTKISALGVEEQRVLVIADIVSPAEHWQRLGDGYRVEASFIIWERNNVLQIPTSALFRYQNDWAVFLVQDDRAQRRPVQVGQRSGLRAQISVGLAAGDRVIVHPDDAIGDGVRITER